MTVNQSERSLHKECVSWTSSRWKWTSQRCRPHQARGSDKTGSRHANVYEPRDPYVRVTEINTGEARSDTFAATQPLKFVRFLLIWAPSYQRKRETRSRENVSMIIMVFDFPEAFFHGNVWATARPSEAVPDLFSRRK